MRSFQILIVYRSGFERKNISETVAARVEAVSFDITGVGEDLGNYSSGPINPFLSDIP